MPNVKFTIDEVILTLDVLYNSNAKRLSPHSAEIKQLSDELNALPIYPVENRPSNFRNCVGVSHQIERFLHSRTEAETGWNVGNVFYEVDSIIGMTEKD